IFCVILAPLALVAWILPGTKKYWDIWQETFSKLLLMFPIVVAVLAAGRIFAKVVAQDYFGALPNIFAPIHAGAAHLFGGFPSFFAVDLGPGITFFVIVIGFFGPYWFLPKTFQWGGNFLKSISGVVNDRSKGLFDRPRNYLNERKKSLGEE